jgi:hypothetical protein
MSDFVQNKEVRAGVFRVEEALAFDPAHKGMGVARFFLGDPENPDTPLILITTYPPNFQVGAHKHTSEYVEIVLEGAVKIGRDWYTRGHIRQVPAGKAYGPLLTGAEGCTAAVVYRSNSSTPIAPRKDVPVPFGPVAG